MHTPYECPRRRIALAFIAVGLLGGQMLGDSAAALPAAALASVVAQPFGTRSTIAQPIVAAAPGPAIVNDASRPNILLILTDDQDLRLDSMDVMPNVKRLLAEQGTTLADYYISDPLCCPSRSTILRSQYTHSHKVFTNVLPAGGYGRFGPTGLEASTVGTWIQAAGYNTAFFGKYLNGYLAGYVDLGPTFAEPAGVTPPSFAEGRSLVPIFVRQPPTPSNWRQAFLIENYPSMR